MKSGAQRFGFGLDDGLPNMSIAEVTSQMAPLLATMHHTALPLTCRVKRCMA